MSNRLYISLDRVMRDWLPDLESVTGYDERVMNYIREVSMDIEEMCKPHTKLTPTYFMPVTETRLFDHAWDTSYLRLDQWLLAVSTSGFTTKNGNTTMAASDYYLMRQGTYNEKPYDRIVMRIGGSNSLEYSGTPQKANSVTGRWGYCEDAASTGATVLNAPLAAGGLSLTVLTGFLETGWMLLIGSEQVFTASISEGDPNDTVTIERGQNGTTDAEHVATTAISRYVPPKDIEKLAGISVARLYHRGTTSFADTMGAPPGGLPYVAANVPDALAVINRYRREQWW